MSSKLKRFLSLLLAFTMVLSIVPVSAEGSDGVVIETGTSEGSVVVKDPVAKIGDTEFDTLEAAFEAAQDGDTIKLLRDVVDEEPVRLSVSDTEVKTITLDLNNKTWDCGYGTRINAVNLTVKNGTIGSNRWDTTTFDGNVDVFHFGGHAKLPSKMEVENVEFYAELHVNNMAPSDEELGLLATSKSAGRAFNATEVVLWGDVYGVVTVQKKAYLTVNGGRFLGGINQEDGAFVTDNRGTGETGEGEEIVKAKIVTIMAPEEYGYTRTERGVTVTFVDPTPVTERGYMQFTLGENSMNFTVQRLIGEKTWETVAPLSGKSTIQWEFKEFGSETFRVDWDNNGTYDRLVVLVKGDVHEVASKGELQAAIAGASDGTVIKLTGDIDYGADHLKITKAIILDLGGHTLTTRAMNYGLWLENDGIIVTNGKLNHAGTVAAIKVRSADEISNLEIDVTGTSSKGNTINGIVIQENSTGVRTLKNVKIHSTSGQGVATGIETNNCGNANTLVIGNMENVTIDAKVTGMSISAPCGTATNCDIKGGTSGIEIWIKGNYSAWLQLANSKVYGGTQAVYAHDEFNSNPATVNNGTLKLLADSATKFTTSENGVLLHTVFARIDEDTQVILPDLTIIAKNTTTNKEYYDLHDALTECAAGETVVLLKDIDFEWAEWTPVTFYGTFEGDGHTIRNLTYVPNENDRMGFFQSLAGTAQNVTLDGIKGTVPAGGNARFGGFARYLDGVATNVHVKNIEVTTTDTLAWVGGFTTYAAGGRAVDCSVENMVVNATAGADLIAGFISLTSNRQLYEGNSVKGFKVTVADTDSSGCGVGGFAAQTQTGWNNPKFEDCHVSGIDVTATGLVDVGGFIAWPGAHTEYANNCTTAGTINVTGVTSSDCFAGGFFGNLGWNCDLGYMGHVLNNCSADVDITTKVAPAGGFVGSATNSNNNSMYATFNNCSASGDITAVAGGTADIGGFFGDADRGVYNNCSASGTVTNNGSGYSGTFGGAIYDVTPKYDSRYPAGTRDYLVDEITLDGCVATGTATSGKFIGNIGDGATVTIKEYVAQVGEDKFETLSDAVAAANAIEGGATVELLKDVELGEKLTITGNVTIEGEYTITRADDYTGTLFAVNAGAALTLDGGLTIDGGNEWTYKQANPALKPGGDTYMSEHVNPEDGGINATAYMIENFGTLNVNNVTIQNNYSTNEAGVIKARTDSNTTINGALIQHIASNNCGAVVQIGRNNVTSSNATLTIKGSTRITDNMGAYNGGIIIMHSQGNTFNFEGGSIDNNYIVASGTVIMSWCSTSANKNTVNMSGGIITENEAEGYGPMYIHTNTDWIMSGGEISENISYYPNYVRSNNTATITGGRIVDNTLYIDYAYTQLAIASASPATITGGTYTQDVTKWLAPDYALIHDEVAGTYTVTDHVYNLYFRDPATGEQVPYVGPLQGNDPADLVATGKAFYANYYDMELEVLYNVKMDDPIVVDYPLTINLNGKTITGVDVYPMVRVQGGANVTVKNGSMTNDDYVFVLGASDGSSAGNLTIESGSYTGVTTVASVTKGKLTINGGQFKVKESEDGATYLLNCIDANYKDGSAKIEVKGGTFYGFDPEDNAAENPKANFCAEGYLSDEEAEGVFTVRQSLDTLDPIVTITFDNSNTGEQMTLKYPSERYDTIQKLIGTNDYADFVIGAEQSELLAYVANGTASNIVMTLHDDVELDAPINFYNKYFQMAAEYDVTLNGNGHTITWADGYTGTLLNVESGVKLTTKNLTIDGENAFTFYNDTIAVEDGQNWYTRFVDVGEEDKAVNANVIVNAGNLTLGEGTKIQNVTIATDHTDGKTENTDEGGYYLKYNQDLALIKSNGGSVTMNGAITGNAGMVLNAVNTSTTINSTISGNLGAGDKGGLIIINGGTANVTGSITDNKAMARSATILGVINGAEVNFNGTMENNKHIGVGSNTAGAMVVLEGASQFVMNGGSISNNVGGRAGAIASRWVGGTYGQHEDTSIVLNDGTITGNTADEKYGWNGASIFLRSPATIGEGMTIDGVIVVNAAPGELAITGGTINKPESAENGLIVTNGLTAEITGGTFNYDPTEWVAEGYEAVEIEEGLWEVQQIVIATVEVEMIPGVWGTSEITSDNWDALVAALGANTNLPVKVTFQHDWTISDTLVVAGNANKVINLNGKTITTAATAAGTYVDAFTILTDVTITGDGTINARPSHGYTFYVGDTNGNAGNLTIVNGNFYGETSVVNNRLGTVNIQGGTFEVSLENEGDTYDYVLNCIDGNYNAGTASIVVTGGTFHNFDPMNNEAEGKETNFVAEGYISETKDEGATYTVRQANYIAQVGETKYESLVEAVAAADAIEGGATVELLADVELGEKLTITGNVTIEGEYTITRADAYTGTLFVVNAGATLTLDGGLTIDGGNEWIFDEAGYNAALADSSKHQDFAFVTSEEGAPVAKADLFTVNGAVVVDNATIQNHMGNSSCNVFGLNANAALTLNDGAKIAHNATPFESTVVAMSAGSTFTINEGAEISGNYAGRNGGVSRNNNGTIVMNGGEIINNYSVNTNGTVFMLYGADSMFEMNDGLICGNTGTNGPNNGRNAVIYGHTGSKMVMNGGSICHNTGTSYGGIDASYTGEAGNASQFEIKGGYVGENVSIIGNANADVNGGERLIVTGGTFTQDVNGWCAPGYEAVEIEEGLWEVSKFTIATVEAELIPGVWGTSEITIDNWTDLEAALGANTNVPVKVTFQHDWTIDETLVVAGNANKVIDLNGKTITTAATAAGTYVDAFTILTDVTITGDGTINARPSHGYTFYVGDTNGNAGNLTIVNGTFYGETSVVNNRLGTVSIQGGSYAVSLENAGDSYNYVLNCIDDNYNAGTAQIVVTGGTFHNFDPMNNEAEGKETNFVAEGYVSETKDDGATYTVRQANYIAQVGDVKYEDLKEAIEACTNGETVMLIADVVYDSDDVVYAHGGATGFGKYDASNPSIVYIGGTKGATAAENQPSNVNAVINLNGHSITNKAEAYLFLFMDNAKVTFVGDGSVTSTTEWPIFWATGAETLLTIDGGTYTTDNDDGLLWSTHSGHVVVNGGYFSTTADDAPLLFMLNTKEFNNPNYFLKGQATLTVYGGTFEGFNPEKTMDDSATPFIETNTVAEGYKAVDNGNGTWTVKPLITVTFDDVTVVEGNEMPELTYTTNFAEVSEDGEMLVVEEPEVTVNGVGEYEITANAYVFMSEKYAVEVVPGTLTVQKAVAVAEVVQDGIKVEYYYATLQEPASLGKNFKLLCDVELTETLEIEHKGTYMKLEGHSITGELETLIHVKADGTVNISGGAKANLQNTGDVVFVESGNLNIYGEITLTSEKANCIYVRGGNTTVQKATLIANGDYPAIQGNGNYAGNVSLYETNVTKAGVTSSNDIAIYWPNNGNLTINGGVITGKTAVYAKSGKITINGGTFIGNGDADGFVPNNNGATATGDAVVIEASSNPAYETPTVSITGGVFRSENAQPIAFYGEGEALEHFVAGGYFNKKLDNNSLIVDGKVQVQVADGELANYWTLGDGLVKVISADAAVETYYATLTEAVAAVQTGETIVLLANSADNIEVNGNISLDVSVYSYTGTVTLTDVAATLTAVDGLDVTTSVENGAVVYADGVYKVVSEIAVTVTINSVDMVIGHALPTEQFGYTVDVEDAVVTVENYKVLDAEGNVIETTGEELPAGTYTITADVVAEAPYMVTQVDGVLTVKRFDLVGVNVAAQDSLRMNFYVKKTDLNGEGYYAVVTKKFADGRADVVSTIDFANWTLAGSNYRFGFSDISAKEMSDLIYVTVYNTDDVAVSNEYIDSIRLYANRMITNNDGELRTAMVDMLNYGAAAQTYFGYDAGNLANADIVDYQQYATAAVTYEDHRVAGDNYVGSTVSAKDRLLLTFVFKNVTTDMTATITYTDHYGNNETITVNGSDFTKQNNWYGVVVTGLSVADGRQLVTCEVKDSDGNVVASATDSIESYCARQSSLAPVFEYLMKFVQSSYNYFH